MSHIHGMPDRPTGCPECVMRDQALASATERAAKAEAALREELESECIHERTGEFISAASWQMRAAKAEAQVAAQAVYSDKDWLRKNLDDPEFLRAFVNESQRDRIIELESQVAALVSALRPFAHATEGQNLTCWLCHEGLGGTPNIPVHPHPDTRCRAKDATRILSDLSSAAEAHDRAVRNAALEEAWNELGVLFCTDEYCSAPNGSWCAAIKRAKEKIHALASKDQP